jgi:WD40 repeat protein
MGKMLASGSDDGTVRLWRMADGALLRALRGFLSYSLGMGYSSALLSTLEGHTAPVRSVAFSPDETDSGLRV